MKEVERAGGVEWCGTIRHEGKKMRVEELG
jgi:hypothetical protein